MALMEKRVLKGNLALKDHKVFKDHRDRLDRWVNQDRKDHQVDLLLTCHSRIKGVGLQEVLVLNTIKDNV
jgi:hypothetical protein